MNTARIPTWLLRQLEDSGQLNTDSYHRRATTSYCRNCGTVVSRGLDADRCGLATTVDITPLNPEGELLALLTGQHTYDLSWRGDHYEIDPRRPAHIKAQPAGGKTPVVTEHKCGQQLAPTPQPPKHEKTENPQCPY